MAEKVGVFRFMMTAPGVRKESFGTGSLDKGQEKARLLELLGNLSQHLSPSFPELVPHTTSITKKIQDEKFNLVVVGQFKRGKSTLVNALIGADILPTAVVPLTSIVTILRYGPEEKITVSFSSGDKEIILRDKLAKYVTERLNPQNIKKVEGVDIELPSKFLVGGVQLVDTPGVGSIYSHNTEAANDFLPESDATIFLMTADQPLSIGEVEFLRNVREHVTKIFFVLNKVDMLTGAEGQEAAEFIRDSLSKEMSVDKESIRLFLLSSKTALKARLTRDEELEKKSNIESLEKSLTNFLSNEKSKVLVNVAACRARKIAAEASTLARLRLKAYSESVESLQKKIDEFKKFKKEVHKRQEDISRVIYTAYNIVTMIEEDTVLFKSKSMPAVEKRLDEVADRSGHLSSSQLIEQLNETIIQLVTETIDKWRYDEESKVRQKFNTGVEELFNRMNSLIDDVYQHATDLFNVEFQRLENYPLFSDETEFYYLILEDIKPSLEELSDAIVKRLPKGIAKHLIRRKEKETLRIEFDRQCGRVRYDFIQRIDKSMLKLGKVLTGTVNEHIERIEKIIVDAMVMREKTSSEASDRIAEYEEKLSKLADLESKFSAIGRRLDSSS